jgi:hypothetical protein
MMAATEQLVSDWFKEDSIIVSHDVFHNVAFCRDQYICKRKIKQLFVNWQPAKCVEYAG